MALVLVLIVWVVSFRPQALGGSFTYVVMHDSSMVPELHDGDLVVANRQASYGDGDVIVYRVPAGQPGAGQVVIHRIVTGDGVTGFLTQGDNSPAPDLVEPKAANVMGKVWFYLPGALVIVVVSVVAGALLVTGILMVSRRRRHTEAAAEVQSGSTLPVSAPHAEFVLPHAGSVSAVTTPKNVGGPGAPAPLAGRVPVLAPASVQSLTDAT